jgi:hypothetical protein
VYRSADNVFEMPPFVESILREDGTHLNSILFDVERVSSHHPIFAVVLHTDTNDAWVAKDMKYQATICYDARFLAMDAGSKEYNKLLRIFENIMLCRVNLLPASSFARAIGLYTELLRLLVPQPDARGPEYCGMFRRDTSSMADMHLRVVLQCFLGQQDAIQASLWPCDGGQVWVEFFNDSSRLYWYHDYVMRLVDATHREGYSVCNVEAIADEITQTQRKNHKSQTSEQLATIRAKQSLLELLKKAYKYRFH